jgi:hypothetical protein
MLLGWHAPLAPLPSLTRLSLSLTPSIDSSQTLQANLFPAAEIAVATVANLRPIQAG